MNEIEVEGRGITSPVVDYEAFADRVVFRIDDESHPEFWMVMTIPAGLLLALAKQMDDDGAEAEGGAP